MSTHTVPPAYVLMAFLCDDAREGRRGEDFLGVRSEFEATHDGTFTALLALSFIRSPASETPHECDLAILLMHPRQESQLVDRQTLNFGTSSGVKLRLQLGFPIDPGAYALGVMVDGADVALIPFSVRRAS